MKNLIAKLKLAVFGLPHLQIRFIASVLGLLMSCSKALGPVTRIMTRTNYAWIHQSLLSTNWDGFAAYTKDCRTEFKFWLDYLVSLNGFPFSPSKTEDEFEFEMAGDASDKGLFAFCYNGPSILLSGECSLIRSQRRALLIERFLFYMKLIVLWKLLVFLE